MSLTDEIGTATSLLKDFQSFTPITEPKKGSHVPRNTFYTYEDGRVVSASKNPKDERSRRFAIRTYISSSVLYPFLRTCPYIQHWGYCVHDKDVNDDGLPKQAHTHLVVYTYSAKTVSAMQKNFDRLDKANPSPSGLPEATHVEIMRDTCASWRYLRHLDNPEKHQYTEDERIADDKSWWFDYERLDGLNDCSNNRALAMFDARANGMSPREFFLKFGRDGMFALRHVDDAISKQRLETEVSSPLSFDRALLDVILSSSNFSKQDLLIFNTVLSYVQKCCVEDYGSSFDIYIQGGTSNA